MQLQGTEQQAPLPIEKQPSKNEVKEMLRKTLSLKRAKQQQKQEEAKSQVESTVNEEQKQMQQEAEFDQQLDMYQPDSNLSSQNLNSNELVFVELFILINEARLHYLRTLCSNPKLRSL